jgi:hypothetical protein
MCGQRVRSQSLRGLAPLTFFFQFLNQFSYTPVGNLTAPCPERLPPDSPSFKKTIHMEWTAALIESSLPAARPEEPADLEVSSVCVCLVFLVHDLDITSGLTESMD